MSLLPSGAGRLVPVYRVIGATELAHLQAKGDYGTSPNLSGKYFALTLKGARALASHPIYLGCVVIRTTLPRSILDQGMRFNDPGLFGAGHSVFFSESQLATVYGNMTLPLII